MMYCDKVQTKKYKRKYDKYFELKKIDKSLIRNSRNYIKLNLKCEM